MSKLVTIFGATGGQGGGLLRAMLKNKDFAIRAVTRNPEGDKGKALKAQGCEVVSADVDDVKAVRAAVDGSHGVFVVTNYWEHFNVPKEIQQGKNVINASKDAGVKHFVYSGLESVIDTLGIDCPHFDSKAEVCKYLETQDLPYTIVRYAAYMENLLGAMAPRKQGEEFVLDIPMQGVPMDIVSTEDVGEVIHQVFNKGGEFIGKKVGLTNDKQTTENYAASLAKVTGKKVIATPMDVKQYAQLPFPGAQEMANMFDFYIRGNPVRDLDLCRKLHPDLMTFEQWAAKNKDTFLSLMK